MLKETFKMRKIGKHLVNVSMLSLAIAPVVGSALAPVTVLAAEQGETRKVEKIPFRTETKEDPTLSKGEKKVIQKGVEGEKEIVTTQKSTTIKSRKPADVVIILDGSTSMSGNYLKSLRAAKALVDSLTDNDRVIVAMYTANTAESYISGNNGYQGGTTVAMTKAEAAEGINKLMAGNPSNARGDLNDFIGAFETKRDPSLQVEQIGTTSIREPKSGTKTPMEELIQKQRRANTTLSIAQFTDGWEDQEAIDTSFVDYAKKNAKTFMSVVFPTGGNLTASNAFGSVAKMTAAGHPNVYKAVDDSKVAEDVIKQFENTAIDVVKGDPVTTEKVIKEPVNEIIAIGTKVAEPKVTKRTEEIPFKTETKEDPTLPEGEKKVVQKGEKGLREFTTTPDVMGNVTGKVDFDIKAGTSTSKETTRKPVDLLAIIDTSSSMVENYGRALDSTLALVKSLNDDDQITFAHYGFNSTDTYNTGNRPANAGVIGASNKSYQGVMTQPMTKKDAIAYLEKAKQFKVTAAGVHLDEFIADMKKQGVKFREDENKNYQDIYMEHHKADSTISVIQFTDGWMDSEDIDKDFAAWATKNAKTFMTVSYKNDAGANGGPTDQSVRKMTEAGHKNIYDERKEAIDNNKIIKQFESTATEKVTVTKQDVNIDVTLTIPKDAKLESAELVTPNGPVKMDIKDNVAVYSGKKVADGHYSLTYKVSGGNGDVKVVVNKDGKELVSKSNKLTTTKGSSTDKVIKEPVNEIIHIGTKGSKSEVTEKKVPFETIYKQDPTLKKGEEKVLQEGVEGVIKVTTTYETQKGKKVDGSEKVTEETVTEKVDKIVAQGAMEKRKVRYRVVDSKGQELVKQTDVMEAYQDEEYKVETPKLDGYRLELAKDSVPATGKVADRDVLVTFVAVKIGKPVTLKFVDESGSEIAEKKVLTGENAEVDTEFTGEAPETIEKDGVKYAFVGIKQTGSKERKVSGKVTDQEQVIEAVYAKPKELPKTSEQAKQRNTAIIALLSVVGLGGLATYLGLRKRDEK